MKHLIGLTIFGFVAFSAVAHSREFSAQRVQKGITSSVTFLIVPTAEGKIGTCRLHSVQDLKASFRQPTLQPSQTFVDTACSMSLAKGSNWAPVADGSGSFKEVLETCMWSKAIPDSPICRAEIQAQFAEELPMGTGYSAVFSLLADTNGRLTSCSFDSFSELSHDPKPVDIKPHELFVSDACRKLSSVKWKAPDPGSTQEHFYMYCRYTPHNPVRAYCERQFGV